MRMYFLCKQVSKQAYTALSHMSTETEITKSCYMTCVFIFMGTMRRNRNQFFNS